MEQTRGLKEITQTMLPLVQSIKTAISVLRSNPAVFDDALESAKGALGLIKEGGKSISQGAEDLILSAHLMQTAVLSLFSTKSRKAVQPISENYITDLSSAEQFVKQSLQDV